MAIEKKYFGIGEVAKTFNVNASLIRYWESQFSEIKPRKNKNGVRQYTKEDIDMISQIHFLIKKRGFTIQGAQNEIARKKEATELVQITKRLKKIKVGLETLRTKL